MNSIHNHDAINSLKEKFLTICETNADLFLYQRRRPKPNEDTGRNIADFTLVFSSNRPLGVRSMILGGRNGYSAGSRIRK